MTETIKLGLPSKGRLQAQCVEWFAARGIEIERTGSDREYAGRVGGVTQVDLVLLSASEIPRELRAGRIHIGVTGMDLIREGSADWSREILELAPLGFGRADLVIAVPAFWIDVRSVQDLDAVAAQFRRNHNDRLRIATKYHTLVRDFLRARGVADYRLVDSQGATEAVIKNRTAEAIADITSTGETLKANHLRPLDDALILPSEAVLAASVAANWSDAQLATLDRLCTKISVESHLFHDLVA